MQVLPFHVAAGREETLFVTSLDDTNYRFRVYWNYRDRAWYFDVAEADGTAIATGVKVVLGVFLARTVAHRLTRDGALFAYDTTRSGREAGPTDIGHRVLVIHVTEDEILASMIAARAVAATARESSA